MYKYAILITLLKCSICNILVVIQVNVKKAHLLLDILTSSKVQVK